MRAIWTVLPLTAIAACAQPMTQESASAGAAARPIVAAAVAASVPGEAGTVLVDCIIEHAAQDELATIAADTPPAQPETLVLISDILARPEAVDCATAGLT